jgi:putative hydrolase of the HAD superfamily
MMSEKSLIIFTDCGDTLVDESTQVMAENGDVLRADMIEGAREALVSLYESGYRIALVADGRVASFRNIFRELGLEHVFEAWVISEELGVEKPDQRMFRTAMERMGLREMDTGRIVMVGNNLKRDILGANRLGIRSILLRFSPRYDMRPAMPEERPDYVMEMPGELPALIERLERAYKDRVGVS